MGLPANDIWCRAVDTYVVALVQVDSIKVITKMHLSFYLSRPTSVHCLRTSPQFCPTSRTRSLSTRFRTFSSALIASRPSPRPSPEPAPSSRIPARSPAAITPSKSTTRPRTESKHRKFPQVIPKTRVSRIDCMSSQYLSLFHDVLIHLQYLWLLLFISLNIVTLSLYHFCLRVE